MIPHNFPSIGKEELSSVSKILRIGQLSTGKITKKFENMLCKFFKIPKNHVVVCSSGTAALYLSLWALSAKNKKILLPTYVCSAVKNAISMVGAKPIYGDVKADYPNLDIKKKIDNKIKIIIAPHMYGVPISLRKKRGVKIIEDCCQSLGAKINNKYTGLIGDCGVLSFYTTKLITSGGHGGAIISKNKKIIDKIKDYLNFDQRFDNKNRFNFLMTDTQAAIGIEQLKKYPKFLKKREKIYNIYKKNGLRLLEEKNNNNKPVRYRALLYTKNQKKIIKQLKKNKINSINPLKGSELLEKKNKNKFPNSLKFTRNLVSLPIYPNLKHSDVLKITRIVKKVESE